VEGDSVPWILGRLTSFASFLNSSSETSINWGSAFVCVFACECVMVQSVDYRLNLGRMPCSTIQDSENNTTQHSITRYEKRQYNRVQCNATHQMTSHLSVHSVAHSTAQPTHLYEEVPVLQEEEAAQRPKVRGQAVLLLQKTAWCVCSCVKRGGIRVRDSGGALHGIMMLGRVSTTVRYHGSASNVSALLSPSFSHLRSALLLN
jgi:hypothetical protein